MAPRAAPDEHIYHRCCSPPAAGDARLGLRAEGLFMACLDWQMPSNISWQRKKKQLQIRGQTSTNCGKKKKKRAATRRICPAARHLQQKEGKGPSREAAPRQRVLTVCLMIINEPSWVGREPLSHPLHRQEEKPGAPRSPR